MSYSKIILDSDIKLSWPYPRTEGEIASDINNVISENDAYTITLPLIALNVLTGYSQKSGISYLLIGLKTNVLIEET